jgi:large subunit ribosomal protein L19
VKNPIEIIESKYTKARPELQVGDTVVVETIIRDGDKKRIQKFQGIIISMKGHGLSKTFTVRKISYGVGVEKIFPLHSANVANITILKHAKVRRSKLYYLRDRIGKAATFLKPGKAVKPSENKVGKDESTEVMEEEPTVNAEAVAAETTEPQTTE